MVSQVDTDFFYNREMAKNRLDPPENRIPYLVLPMSDSEPPKKRVANGGARRYNPASDPPVKRPARKKVKKVNTHATTQRNYDFRRRTLPKIDELIEAAKIEKENIEALVREKDRLKKDIERKKQLIAEAPSLQDQQKLVMSLFKEKDVQPIEQLIDLARDHSLPARDRAMIWKMLAEYTTPKPKTIDTQKGEEMNLSISMVDFTNTSQQDLKTPNELPADEDYEQFTLKDDKV